MQDRKEVILVQSRVGRNEIEQVVVPDHRDPNGADPWQRQADQEAQDDHRPPDRPDHLQHPHPSEEESPARVDDCEFEQDQPDASHEEPARERLARHAAMPDHVRARAREEHKYGCAEVCHPSRHVPARRRELGIQRVEGRRAEVVASVVERHHNHRQTAEDVDGSDASVLLRLGQFWLGRGHSSMISDSGACLMLTLILERFIDRRVDKRPVDRCPGPAGGRVDLAAFLNHSAHPADLAKSLIESCGSHVQDQLVDRLGIFVYFIRDNHAELVELGPGQLRQRVEGRRDVTDFDHDVRVDEIRIERHHRSVGVFERQPRLWSKGHLPDSRV